MTETYFPIRVQRIWQQAIRACLASTRRPGITALRETELVFLRRALNAFVQVPKGAEPRFARSIEASRERIRANEESGEDPVPIAWFDEATAFVSDVDDVYEALYEWHCAVREYLERIVPALSEEEHAGLKRILQALIQPTERTKELAIDRISGALLDELGQDEDFDVYYWTGTAMAHVDGVIAILAADERFSAAKTIPPLDPLPDDGPEITIVGEGQMPPEDPPAAPILTLEKDSITGMDHEHYTFDVTDDD